MELFAVLWIVLLGVIFFLLGITILIIGLAKNKIGYMVGGGVAIIKSFIFIFLAIFNYFINNLNVS